MVTVPLSFTRALATRRSTPAAPAAPHVPYVGSPIADSDRPRSATGFDVELLVAA